MNLQQKMQKILSPSAALRGVMWTEARFLQRAAGAASCRSFATRSASIEFSPALPASLIVDRIIFISAFRL